MRVNLGWHLSLSLEKGTRFQPRVLTNLGIRKSSMRLESGASMKRREEMIRSDVVHRLLAPFSASGAHRLKLPNPGLIPISANLSDSKLAEALICRRKVSVCTALKRCKAGTLRLLSLKLTLMGLKPWAEIWSPFRGESRTASHQLTRNRQMPDRVFVMSARKVLTF